MRVSRVLPLLIISIMAPGQSGSSIANFRKEVFIPQTAETVILSDAVRATLTLAPAEGGTRVTLRTDFDGRGIGDVSQRDYFLGGTDEQSGMAGVERPARVDIATTASLTTGGTSASIPLRIVFRVRLYDGEAPLVSVQKVEAAQ